VPVVETYCRVWGRGARTVVVMISGWLRVAVVVGARGAVRAVRMGVGDDGGVAAGWDDADTRRGGGWGVVASTFTVEVGCVSM